MIEVSGYKTTEKIYESNNSIIFRAKRIIDNKSVVVKLLKNDYPTPLELARFKREYEITNKLNIDGVIKVYSLEKYKNTLSMILEDFGGKSLEKIPAERKNGFTEFLNIAIQIVDILGKIHHASIIHKDINPANILFNSDNGFVKIIDFGISTELSKEVPSIINPGIIEGTLAYISPEQTGRMNRSIDYRTDFYSLGATFYKILTGRLPFETTDPMELIHYHIAKAPVPVYEFNSYTPKVVSDIILKLMAKNAEDRYQSAFGIITDLKLCLSQFNSAGKILYFPVGQKDISNKFQISQKLYGREKEIKILLTAFENVCSDNKELILIPGSSGTGKSALIHEVYKTIIQKRGYFISGKHDQFNRNIPYNAFISAFRGLISQFLAESEDKIAILKDDLLKALGTNGQLMVDVIPELELIIGKQNPLIDLPPAESQNRFILVFRNFVHTFAGKDHPLVIFLDDLQWADTPSIKMIELLMTDIDSSHLLIICAYRDNEMNETDSFSVLFENIQNAKIKSLSISLKDLSFEHVHQLIADSLKCEISDSFSIAKLCWEKTRGNPFFVNQFLHLLYDTGLILFNESKGAWIWDIEKIQNQEMTDNVVELLSGKIQKLSIQTQSILQVAACIGNVFDLKTLSMVYERSFAQTAQDLWESLKEELIIPADNSYKFIENSESSNQIVVYKFSHDRVWQATYSLIRPENQREIHLKIGRLMLKNLSESERKEKLFDIINHMNIGSDLIHEHTEKDAIAQMNLLAGKRAKSSAAYEPSYSYLKEGISLIGKNSWQRDYDLTLDLYIQTAEAAYLNADFTQMNSLCDLVLQNAKTLLDKVKVYEIKIRFFITQETKQKEAIQTALYVLKLLDIHLPEKPNKLHIISSLLKTKLILAGTKIEDILRLPEMTDPYKIAGSQILVSIGTAVYQTSPQLIPLMVFKGIQLFTKYGNTPLCSDTYAGYGLILCGALGDIDSGYRFGKIAFELVERSMVKQKKARTYFILGSIIHWKEHLCKTLPILLDGYQSALENGDFEFAGHCAVFYVFHSYFLGKNLHIVQKEMKKYHDIISHLKLDTILPYAKLWMLAVMNLSEITDNPCLLKGNGYDEDEMWALYNQVNDKTGLCSISYNKLILCYLFHDYQKAIQHADMAEKYLEGIIGSAAVAMFYFYDSLSRLAELSQASTVQKRQFLKKVYKNQKKMNKWARHAPENYLHKWYLVEAELARVKGEGFYAMQFYTKAIELAGKNDYLQEQALANELAGKFYLSLSQENIAKTYLHEAFYLYSKWGAKSKVSDLTNEYPQVFKTGTPANETSTTLPTSVITTTTGSGTGNIDLASVMKASMAISGEIVFSELIKSMINIVMQNAGAQRVLLLMEQNGNFVMEAEGLIDTNEVNVLNSIPLESVDNIDWLLPISIIKYVIRTREFIVIDDAAGDKKFDKDPYIKKNQPKSLLCQPILNKGYLAGILYLENNLTSRAFTPNRVEVLKLISSQAAISIDNARLYAQLEGKNLDLRKIYEQVNHLLEATKEMSTAKNKLSAGQTAVTHLLALEKKLDVSKVKLYLPKKSSHSFIGYVLWQNDQHQNNPTPYDADLDKVHFLENTTDISKTDGKIVIPVKSKKEAHAYIEIECKLSEAILDKLSLNFISGIIHSLSLILENIESEENNRLASIGSMAASIVHDLKNPIGVIMGYADMASDEDITETKRNEYLDIIVKEANRMSDMAHEVLEFSKGELSLQMDEVKSDEYMKDITVMLSPIFISNNIEFNYEDRYLGIIKFDSEKFRRVILNIATNARDAMLNAKTKNPSFHLKFLRDFDGISMVLKDNGPGIPEHIKSTLFEPFVTFGKSHGTGLGMAIVKKIITSHCGTIGFESEKEKGTAFTIVLPFSKEILNKKIPESNDIKNLNTKIELLKDKRILIVDDAPMFGQTYADWLGSGGFSVDMSFNGNAALVKLNDAKKNGKPFDIIIISKQLPGTDGETLGGVIKKNADFSDIMMIIIDNKGERGDASKAEEIGFDAYFAKPVKESELFECINVLFSKDKQNHLFITRKKLFEEQNNKSNIRILVAEDNILNQQLILRYLNKMGYHADIVSNGKEAVDTLEKSNYEIVLMDVEMPVMNGLEATKVIRDPNSKVLNHDVIIIALTGRTLKEDIEKCHQAGINDHIAKPFKREQLANIIELQIKSC